MNFFKTIHSSIYSPSFYRTIPQKPFAQAVKYYLFLALLLTIITIVFPFQNLVIETPKVLRNLIEDTINCYPKDLEIKISKGLISTNVKEPYFLTNCGSNANFAVIDTKTAFSQEKFKEYNTKVWLTKNSIVVKDDDYQTRLFSLIQVDNFSLNKESLTSLHKQFAPYLNFVGPILLFLALVGISILYLFRLIQLLLTASLIWLLGKLFKHKLNFSSSYKLGLFAATLGLIVDLIVNATSKYTAFYGFPFMFTAITLGVVVVNLFLPAKKASS